MLKNFKNWLLENKYSELTSADYAGRIERLCRKEGYTLAHLVENIASIIHSVSSNKPVMTVHKTPRVVHSCGTLCTHGDSSVSQ